MEINRHSKIYMKMKRAKSSEGNFEEKQLDGDSIQSHHKLKWPKMLMKAIYCKTRRLVSLFSTSLFCSYVYFHLSLSAWAAITEYCKPSSLNNRILFVLTVLEAEGPRSRCWHGLTLVRALPGVAKATFLHVSTQPLSGCRQKQ